MKKIISLSWLLGFLFFVSFVQAEGVSLEQALKQAYEQNYSLLIERQKVEGARARILSVKKLPDPEIEFEVGGLEESSSNLDSFSLKQPFDVLPSQIAEIQAAKELLASAQSRLKRRWALVGRDVKVTYAQILVTQKEIENAQTNLNVTQQFLSLVQTRFQSGTVLRSDLIRAKIEVLRAQREFLRDQEQLKLDKAKLNLLMGQDVLSPIEIREVLRPIELGEKLESLLNKAGRLRADLEQKKRELKASEKIFQSEKIKAFLPKTGIGVEKTREDFEDDTSVFLEFSYPLWSFNQGKKKEAKALMGQNQLELQAIERQVQFDVYQGVIEMQLAEQDLRLQEEALQEANELMRQSLVQYQEGELSFLKYLESLSAIRETRLSYFRSLALVHEMMANLELAIGEEIQIKE